MQVLSVPVFTYFWGLHDYGTWLLLFTLPAFIVPFMDVADWDRSVATNVPGQSGQSESKFYGNLLPLWDRGEYFPLVYTRGRVDGEAAHKLTLRPAATTSRQ